VKAEMKKAPNKRTETACWSKINLRKPSKGKLAGKRRPSRKRKTRPVEGSVMLVWNRRGFWRKMGTTKGPQE